ncbi:MAG: formylglycine-generating enzyme family protein [Leptospiraceae bacterium]|nr:formylglycine-generating enzyme family protein [Leptospiraceae bacterium]
MREAQQAQERRWLAVSMLLAVAAFAVAPSFAQQPDGMVRIPSGTFVPFLEGPSAPPRPVPAFQMDRNAVTVGAFRNFLAENERWQRGQVPAVFADQRYLQSLDSADANAPAVHVSWFAARAYCEWVGKRLPTLDEWERAAAARDVLYPNESEAAFATRILQWYASPNPARLPAVRSTYLNRLGLYDMHGLIWEWVLDFNQSTVTGDSRGDSELERNLFCGGASSQSRDPSDYAAFMRYAYRSSLRAASTAPNLGFRCARDL